MEEVKDIRVRVGVNKKLVVEVPLYDRRPGNGEWGIGGGRLDPFVAVALTPEEAAQLAVALADTILRRQDA